MLQLGPGRGGKGTGVNIIWEQPDRKRHRAFWGCMLHASISRLAIFLPGELEVLKSKLSRFDTEYESSTLSGNSRLILGRLASVWELQIGTLAFIIIESNNKLVLVA